MPPTGVDPAGGVGWLVAHLLPACMRALSRVFSNQRTACSLAVGWTAAGSVSHAAQQLWQAVQRSSLPCIQTQGPGRPAAASGRPSPGVGGGVADSCQAHVPWRRAVLDAGRAGVPGGPLDKYVSAHARPGHPVHRRPPPADAILGMFRAEVSQCTDDKSPQMLYGVSAGLRRVVWGSLAWPCQLDLVQACRMQHAQAVAQHAAVGTAGAHAGPPKVAARWTYTALLHRFVHSVLARCSSCNRAEEQQAAPVWARSRFERGAANSGPVPGSARACEYSKLPVQCSHCGTAESFSHRPWRC